MQMLGAETDRIMHVLVMNDSIPLDDGLLDIHRSGICIADRTERTLKFSSEIMRVFYRDLYFKAIYGVGGSNVITSWTNETVLTLLKRILELFNPQVFLSTQARGRDGLRYERIYQDEFTPAVICWHLQNVTLMLVLYTAREDFWISILMASSSGDSNCSAMETNSRDTSSVLISRVVDIATSLLLIMPSSTFTKLIRMFMCVTTNITKLSSPRISR